MNEDLGNWFDKNHPEGNWKRYNTKGEAIGPCAREPGESKPKCLSNEKAAKMSKDEIAAAVRRKRKKDPVANRQGKGEKPIMSSNKIEEAKKERDHEHSMARSELATIENAVKRLKTKLKGEGNIEAWVQSKITKAADYIDSAADYLDSGEHNVQGSMDEAKKNPCWKRYRKKPGTADYAKGSCVPESVSNEPKLKPKSGLGGGKPTYLKGKEPKPTGAKLIKGNTNKVNINAGFELPLVDKILLEMELEILNEKNVPTNPKLWAKWKSKAKAKFDVYPSAYANGWAAKGYKSEGGRWKSVSENITIEDANGITFAEVIDLIVNEEQGEEKYCKKCKKKEKRSECKYGPETWDEMTDDDSNDVSEAIRMPSKNGNIVLVNFSWRGKLYSIKMFFPQVKIPSRSEVMVQLNKVYPGARLYHFAISDYDPSNPLIHVSEDWQKKNREDKTPGMGREAIKKYREENPNSKLKPAVTGDPEPDSEDAKRKKSFCARSEGQQDMHNIDCTKTPDKPICAARRRWKC